MGLKAYPFEVVIAGRKPSTALADQVKSLDWMVRGATRKGKVTAGELSEVRRKATLLTGQP